VHQTGRVKSAPFAVMAGLVPAIHVDRPHRHFAYRFPRGIPSPVCDVGHTISATRLAAETRRNQRSSGGGTVDCSHGDSRVNLKTAFGLTPFG